MKANPIIPRERIIEELTQYRNPALSEEEAEKVADALTEDLSFWMGVDQLFHKRAEEIRNEINQEQVYSRKGVV